MESQVLLLALIKKVEEKLEQLNDLSAVKPLRGRQGPPGKDFDIDEHKETLRAWAKEFALKFEHYTAEQIELLKGPKGESGRDGRDGRDGKNFSLEENKDYLESLAKNFALKFEDFTSDQIEKLRGPQGAPGKDFDWIEHQANIINICKEIVECSKDELTLKFENLTEEQISSIRGPKGRDGRDGRDGKDFVFEEHLEFFNNLKLKFSELSPDDVEKLKLQFSHLTEDEKNSLKLKFSDLSEEDKMLLRGPRGQRGKTGEQGDSIQGPRGEKGEKGDSIRGLPGPRGFSGINGRDGRDGKDGADAPIISDIRAEQTKDEVEFVFEFSDGSEIRTDPIKLPRPNSYIAGGGVSSSSSGSGINTYANFASLPSGQPDGSVAVTLDTHQLYIYNEGTATWTLSSGSGGSSGLDLVSYTQFGGL